MTAAYVRGFARAAFAVGYAEIPGAIYPVPDSVKDACMRAMDAAEEVPPHPAVIEAVRKQAKLVALWHTIEKRRVAMDDRYSGRLGAVLDSVRHRVAAAAADAVLTASEAVQPLPPGGRSGAVARVEAALDLVIAGDAAQQLRQLVADALLEATAEGMVDGQAYLMAVVDGAIPDFGIAFDHAIAQLRHLPPAWDDADTWMGRVTGGLSYQLGNRMATAIEQGADRGELLNLADTVIGGDGNYADLWLNHAIATATTDGAASLYRSEGVEEVDVLVSPDACDECAPLEGGNPYTLDHEPDIPLHPRCRCAIAPHV